MRSGEAAALEFILKLRSDPTEEGLLVHVLSADACRRLQSRSDTFVVRIWHETSGVIRVSITDIDAGGVAMLQGNDALRRLAATAELHLTSSP